MFPNISGVLRIPLCGKILKPLPNLSATIQQTFWKLRGFVLLLSWIGPRSDRDSSWTSIKIHSACFFLPEIQRYPGVPRRNIAPRLELEPQDIRLVRCAVAMFPCSCWSPWRISNLVAHTTILVPKIIRETHPPWETVYASSRIDRASSIFSGNLQDVKLGPCVYISVEV